MTFSSARRNDPDESSVAGGGGGDDDDDLGCRESDGCVGTNEDARGIGDGDRSVGIEMGAVEATHVSVSIDNACGTTLTLFDGSCIVTFFDCLSFV